MSEKAEPQTCNYYTNPSNPQDPDARLCADLNDAEIAGQWAWNAEAESAGAELTTTQAHTLFARFWVGSLGVCVRDS